MKGNIEALMVDEEERQVIPEGYRRLLAKVLALGVLEAIQVLGMKSSCGTPDLEPSRQAVAWIRSKRCECSPETGMTFEWICQHLQLDAGQLRKAVLGRRVSVRANLKDAASYLNELEDRFFGKTKKVSEIGQLAA